LVYISINILNIKGMVQMNNKKQKMSLFLVTMSTSSMAIASTCSVGFYDPINGSNCIPAPLGRYVPVAGATSALSAEPGTFVASTGQSEPTLAPPGRYAPFSEMTEALLAPVGYYVPNAGASSAFQAPAGTYAPTEGMTAPEPSPVGYYVPTAGSGQATAVSSGFYAPVTGLTQQLPAGGLAAPLTAALQASDALNQISMDLLNLSQETALKVATSYQQNTVKQEGLRSGEFKTNITSIAVQADLVKSGDQHYGVQASYANHHLNNPDVKNTGDSYQVGAFKTGNLNGMDYQVMAVIGKTSSDNQRTVTVNSVDTNNLESLLAQGDISWYGIKTKLTYPLTKDVATVAELGVLSYKADALNESGTATSGGASVAAVSALRTQSLHFTSIPVMLGISYDLLPKKPNQSLAPVVATLGVVSNLANTENLRYGSSSGSNLGSALAVKQSSLDAALLKISFNGWEVTKNLNVLGILQTQVGSDSTVYQASLNLIKKW
jgi:hypothetical protein